MPRYHGLSSVRVFVDTARWPACVAFYADTLGLPLRSRDDGGCCAVFGFSDGTSLVVERADGEDGDEEDLAGRFTGVAIAVEDVVAAHAELASRGVKLLGNPERDPRGRTLFHFEDPEGNTLTLVERDAQPPAPART